MVYIHTHIHMYIYIQVSHEPDVNHFRYIMKTYFACITSTVKNIRNSASHIFPKSLQSKEKTFISILHLNYIMDNGGNYLRKTSALLEKHNRKDKKLKNQSLDNTLTLVTTNLLQTSRPEV